MPEQERDGFAVHRLQDAGLREPRFRTHVHRHAAAQGLRPWPGRRAGTRGADAGRCGGPPADPGPGRTRVRRCRLRRPAAAAGGFRGPAARQRARGRIRRARHQRHLNRDPFRTRRKEAQGVRPHPTWLSRNYLALSAVAVLSACFVAACSSSSSTTGTTKATSSPTTAKPILIGASLSLTGDFSADGQAFDRGYKLWASDVNSSGGLLGRQVQLKILNDNSSPTQAQTNYQTLFASDKVDLAFGPFSSLLTTPSASVAARYGYALVEGAGGAPTVFASPANQSAHNIFDVSLPIEDELIPFVNWVASLPPGQRPKTAAYPMADDPFADPPVQLAQKKLQALGVKTVYSKIFPAENASYKPAADQVANTGAQAVLLGSTDVPTVSAFMQAFEQQHYNPKMFICAAGPDQGASFTSAVGKGNATGMMVPNGWYPGYANPASQKMVNEYVAKYGGSPSDVNADVAEAYSVGQVMAQAVTGTKGTNNPKIITYLHSGVTISTVQGPVRFDNSGRNASAAAFTFQWQQQGTAFKQVLPVSAAGSVTIINPKPNWTS